MIKTLLPLLVLLGIVPGQLFSQDTSKKDPEKFLAELKFHQPDGSVLRQPKEDWEGARRRMASDPAWAAWVAEQRKDIDSWIAKRKDRPTWRAGGSGDLVSPKDGSRINWTPETPGEEVEFLTSSTDDHIKITPEIFDAWVDQFRKKHVIMIADSARLFHLTGEKRYAEWAAAQLDFYAQNLDRWPMTRQGSNPARLGILGFNDAVMLTSMVEAARLLFDWAGEARRRMWFDKLFKPEAEMLEQHKLEVNNHLLWVLSARAQVALLFGDEAMWHRAVDAESGLRDQMRKGVTSEWFWFEQSATYQAFVIGGLRPIMLFSGLIGKGEQLHVEAAILENMTLAAIMFRFPDNTIPNPADSTSMGVLSTKGMEICYRFLPTFPGLEAAAKIRSWDTLVDPPEEISSRSPAKWKLPEVVSINMESSRFGIMRKGPWQVFFHYGQLTPYHSQAEALNWTASFEDKVITKDPGTVGYGSALYQGYYARGLNHNVPLIDGEGQKPWNLGNLITFDAAKGVMAAEQPNYRPGVSVRRTLSIDGNSLVDEAAISTKEAKAAKLGLSLHLEGKPILPDSFHPVTDFAKGRPEPFRQWKDVRSATFRDHAEIEVAFPGGKSLQVTFSVPGEFTLYQGSSPSQPPKRRAAFYLETEGVAAVFTTKFVPLEEKKKE